MDDFFLVLTCWGERERDSLASLGTRTLICRIGLLLALSFKLNLFLNPNTVILAVEAQFLDFGET